MAPAPTRERRSAAHSHSVESLASMCSAVWQVLPSGFGNGLHDLEQENPLRDKDVTVSIEVKS